MSNLSSDGLWPAMLLTDPSIEVTTRDRDKLGQIAASLPRGSRIFIAGLAADSVERTVSTAAEIRRLGHRPVPHIVARNTVSGAELERRLQRLAEEAGVTAALVVGGDADKPAGPYASALELLQTGHFRKYGFVDLFIGCYPERHPRIEADALDKALGEKLMAVTADGHKASLISQLCFEAESIARFTKRLRRVGVEAPLHVGVAGPAKAASLLKYAALCGVGPSLRALKERHGLTRNLMAGITPDSVLAPLASLMTAEMGAGVAGAHFFTFGSPQKTVEWIEAHRPATAAAAGIRDPAKEPETSLSVYA